MNLTRPGNKSEIFPMKVWQDHELIVDTDNCESTYDEINNNNDNDEYNDNNEKPRR